MDDTLFEQLRQYQTDHLILLVGTNPLPNYVAAQLLLRPGGQVHLLCSSGTQEIANRLAIAFKALRLSCRVLPHIDEGLPAEIYARTEKLIDGLGSKLSLGLNYTGGTKPMSVHAYRAAQSVCESDARKVVFSYLDPRKMALVISGGLDGRDAEIPVSRAVNLKVDRIAELHGITFKKTSSASLPNAIDDALRALHGTSWHRWTKSNLFKPGSTDKLKPSSELKSIPAPGADVAGHLPELFMALGAPASGATIADWARAANFSTNKDGMESFVGELGGGYWFERLVLRALESVDQELDLADVRSNLIPDRDAYFEFDVAAVQGYRLYGISCTTSGKADLCKSKLMEAYIRARQLGGDEARVALVCGSDDPDKVLDGFKSSNYVANDEVKVFGKQSWDTLAANLKEWMAR